MLQGNSFESNIVSLQPVQCDISILSIIARACYSGIGFNAILNSFRSNVVPFQIEQYDISS